MMKSLVPAVLYVAIGALAVFGQNGGSPSEKGADAFSAHDLGGKWIKIPSPDNFTNSFNRFPQIAGRFIASESPLNEVLAAHIVDSVVPLVEDGSEPEIPFYTKASVPKHLRGIDVSADDFRALAAEFRRLPPLALQEVLKKDEKEADARLSNFWGTSANMKIGETRLIGQFDDNPRSISSLFVSNTEVFGKSIPLIGSMTMVHLNGRLLFLYVFRVAPGEADKGLIVSLTRSWIEKTVQANTRSQG